MSLYFDCSGFIIERPHEGLFFAAFYDLVLFHVQGFDKEVPLHESGEEGNPDDDDCGPEKNGFAGD